jgi:ribosomal protein L40E
MREQTMAGKNICSECNAENSSSAKFCLSCGNEFHEDSSEVISNSIVCPGCGSKNDDAAKFCANCGHELAGKRPTAKPKKPQPTGSGKKARQPKLAARLWNPIIIGLVLGGLFIIYLLAKDNRPQVTTTPGQFQPIIEQKTNNVELEAKVIEVASKFACSCGSCGAAPLETCTCETAQQERQFIREALQKGQAIPEVVLAVNSKYGWLKGDQQNSPTASGLDLQSSLIIEFRQALLRLTKSSIWLMPSTAAG